MKRVKFTAIFGLVIALLFACDAKENGVLQDVSSLTDNITYDIISENPDNAGAEKSSKLCIEPLSIKIEDALPDETSEREIRLISCGDKSLEIKNVEIISDKAERFAVIDKPVMPLVLARGESVIVKVRYTADRCSDTAAYDEAKLKIITDASNASDSAIYVNILAQSIKGEVTNDRNITDTFVSNSIKGENILWCIDTTKSMADERENIKPNLKKFISYLTKRDTLSNEYNIIFNLSVVLEESDEPFLIGEKWYYPGVFIGSENYPKIISDFPPPHPRNPAFEPVTEKFEEAFLANSSVLQDRPDGKESCLLALKKALSDPNINDPAGNKGFLDNDYSYLTLLILTDSDDNSSAPVSFYSDFFKTIRNEKLINVFVIAGFDPGSSEPKPLDCGDVIDGKGAVAAKRYAEFMSKFENSHFASICSPDWADYLFEKHFNRSCNVEYYLSRRPEVGSIEVFRDNINIPRDDLNGFVYNSEHNSVYFTGNAVPANCPNNVTIRYKAACN